MTSELAAPLRDIVTEDALARAEGWPSWAGSAEAIVEPATEEEIQAVVRWANDSGTRVVAAGSGRHSGGAPDEPFVVLSTRRLSEISIYEGADLTLTAGAGLGISELLRAASANDQWLPFDPPDFPRRTLGGLVAAGRTGPLQAGYGELKNHVLGASVVCGDGRRLRLGGRVVKNVAGFDLLRPVVGSRGSLAVITSVTVRLFPVPAVDRLLVLESSEPETLLPVARALATAPVMPVSLVLARFDGAWTLMARLHGASTTLDAEEEMLRRHAGAAFTRADGDAATAQCDRVRDIGLGQPECRLYGLPAGIGDRLQAAVSATEPSAPIVADVHMGTVSVYGALAGPLEKSPVDPGALELARGLKRVFDPAGTLGGLP